MNNSLATSIQRGLLLDVWERRLQQVGGVLPQEQRVADARVRYGRGVEQRYADLVCLHELEHASEKHALELEPGLVIRVREHVENILHDAKEVLLEECVRDLRLRAGKVVDDLETH